MNKLIYILMLCILATGVLAFEESFSVRGEINIYRDDVKLSLWSTMEQGYGTIIQTGCYNNIQGKNKCYRYSAKIKQISREGTSSNWIIDRMIINRQYYDYNGFYDDYDFYPITLKYDGKDMLQFGNEYMLVKRVR